MIFYKKKKTNKQTNKQTNKKKKTEMGKFSGVVSSALLPVHNLFIYKQIMTHAVFINFTRIQENSQMCS